MELKPHQLQTVEFLHKTGGRTLVNSDPGTGKTACAVTYLAEAKHWPALLVCPASVKGTWKKELKQWAGVEGFIIDGRSGEVPTDYQAYIINYDLLKHRLKDIYALPLKAVVYDESHKLSNRTTGWTRAALALSRRVTHVIAMSGTPISNRPSDFWPTLNIIRPAEFPTFQAYAWQYCDPRRTTWGWDYTGCSNLDQLHERIKPFTIGFKKEDVLQLPKRHVKVIPVEIADEAEYREAEKDFLKWLAKNKKGSVEKAKKAEAVVKTSYILTLAAKLKTRAVIKWLRNELAEHPEKKIIVFCTHTGMREVLCRYVAPDQTVFIDGSVPSKKRHEIVEKFQHDPEIRLFVGNIAAAGAGITLTAATTTVFAELPWTPSAVKQASDRNYRIGQENEVTLGFLVARGTIEEKIARILQTKADISDLILQGSKMRELPLFDMLGEIAG